MESLTASFRSINDMEQAAEALRKQGAVDLKLRPEASGAAWGSFPEAAGDDPNSGAWSQSRHAGLLQVVVESSRVRQAEDIIARYGGEY